MTENIWLDNASGWKEYPPFKQDVSISGLTDQETTELNFRVNGIAVSTISTATYTAILPFAYVPVLHAFTVEFPLDVGVYIYSLEL